LADLLETEVGAVGLKATTNEKLGWIGRGEGMAAIAVVLLKRKSRSD
jgi:2-C-methyl-D-erythritol 2,4-cyclodiphosphate synthase